MSVGENIKAQRTRLRLSQEYVADQLGVSRQAVSKWETGQSTPTSSNLAELAALFDVSISELIEPERFCAARQAERERAAESYRNRRMLRSRYYGYLAIWAGYRCFRHAGSGGDGGWMRVWGLLVFLAGFVFVMISSVDYSRRASFSLRQILVGAVFFCAAFFLPERLPEVYGMNQLASAALCGVCIWFLCERCWKRAWPYREMRKETLVQ